jgi:hypothetical protein
MNATFPMRKSYVLLFAVLAFLFSLIILGHLIAPLLMSSEKERIPMIIIGWGLGGFFWGGVLLMQLYLLRSALKMKVIVQGNKVTDIGSFSRQFDLSDVTAAQWQFFGRMRRPRLLVTTPLGFIPFDFRIHRSPDARQMIRYFRNGLSPQIQEGWDSEWDSLAVSLDTSLPAPLPWSKLLLACLLAGVGAGLICGLIATFMLSSLDSPYSWSGSHFVDWTVYGIALSLVFSIPLSVVALLVRYGRWLDA